MPSLSQQVRSTYRAILRELPSRPLSRPSPLHQRIREVFRAPIPETPEPEQAALEREIRIAEAAQFAHYARAQRSYAALLERYNPGMNLDEEEKIRLTARRVGLDLPVLGKEEK
ncbi:hypothetical protein MPDQ_001209 [Monascus purpureus]|uniref:Uncharacterized protein n=1 Tax=Monascus purpureus TaxID=5098 RepID=A0A507R4V6_MONPU|nr:hypothetical protein MPDQ_001209 [Monascus purpureus]BDD61388.1 hypothetical protein MAP00_006433 [Monascus purpureus]